MKFRFRPPKWDEFNKSPPLDHMGAPPSPLSVYNFSAFSWVMTLSSYLTHSLLCEFFQTATISSQARLISNDTSHQCAWISNGMSNSLPSEWHFDCHSIQHSYIASHLTLVGNSSPTRFICNLQWLQYTLLQW